MTRFQYRRPANEDAFEDFCLALLRDVRSLPRLERYGRRGERQHGVDLLDLSGSTPLFAAQCKHHESSKTIPASELEEEVRKALTFPKTIGEYVVLTTGKKTAGTQRAVQQINADHAAKDLFLVTLLTWEDIEPLIAASPKAQELLELRVAETTIGILRSELKTHLEPLHEAIVHQAGDHLIDSELDEVKAKLRAGEPTAALLLVERARRAWSRGSPKQRSRLCALEADARFRLGERHRAARLLIEARTHDPDDEKTAINEILARQVLDEVETARSVASEARQRFPLSAGAHASCIQLASTAAEAAANADSVPSTIADSPEVLSAIGERSDLGDRALQAARRATDLAPEEPRGWFALGSRLLERQVANLNSFSGGTPTSASAQALEEARNAFTKVVEIAVRHGDAQNQVAALLPRMTVSGILNDEVAVQHDAERALQLLPDDPFVLVAAGRAALERRDANRAVELLQRAYAKRDYVESRFFLGVALWNRNQNDDRSEATKLLSVVAAQDCPHRELAAELSVEGLLAVSDLSGASAFLGGLGEGVGRALTATLRGRIATASGDSAQAHLFVDLALAENSAAMSFATRLRLGTLLMSLGRHADALRVLEPIAAPGGELEAGARFVECATRLDRHDIVLKYCREARTAGVYDDFFLERELRLLDQYDPTTAIAVLREVVARTPEKHVARVHLMLIAVRLGDLKTAREHADALPHVREVTADEGVAVVGVLLALDRGRDALTFAYELLRLHFEDHRAHRVFRDAVISSDRKDKQLEEPNTVAPGVAVCLVEDGSPPRWYVLEDSAESAAGVEHEIRANSSRAKRLMGLVVGDEVVLADEPMRRVARVDAIVSKQTFRLRDVCEQWQFRFPDQQEMWMMRIADDDGDFTYLLDFAAHLRKRGQELDDLFAKHAVPVGAFAKLIGRTELEAVGHIAGRESLRLLCCRGTLEEFDEAQNRLGLAGEVVLELSTIATLTMADEIDALAFLGKRVLVSPSTMLTVRRLAEERKLIAQNHAEAGGSAVTTEPTPIDRMLAWLEQHATMLNAVAIANLEPEARKVLTQLLGVAGLESVVLAAQPNRILWSDDGVLAGLAREKFGVPRIWSQAVFNWLVAQGRAVPERHAVLSARLIAWGYDFTSSNQGTMRAAGKLASWKLDDVTLKAAITYVSLSGVALNDAVRLTAQLVKEAFGDIALADARQDFLLATLDSLGRRADLHERALDDLERLLPMIFGVNVLGAHDATRTLAVWRAARHHRVVRRQ